MAVQRYKDEIMKYKQEIFQQKQARLLEIYKLQTNQINEKSNRRVLVNRYYILVLSGLILAFSALLQIDKDSILHSVLLQNIENSDTQLGQSQPQDPELQGVDETNDPIKFAIDLFEGLIIVIGSLGILLSYAWYIDIHAYLEINTKMYKTIAILEDKLDDFKFYKEQKKLKGYKDEKNKTYKELSRHILLVPAIFYVGFSLLFSFGIALLSRKVFYGFIVIPVLLIIPILYWTFYKRRKKND